MPLWLPNLCAGTIYIYLGFQYLNTRVQYFLTLKNTIRLSVHKMPRGFVANIWRVESKKATDFFRATSEEFRNIYTNNYYSSSSIVTANVILYTHFMALDNIELSNDATRKVWFAKCRASRHLSLLHKIF
jgi:hypothetical protein